MSPDENLKPYLLTVDTTRVPIEKIVHGVIDQMPEVKNWFKFLPGAAIIVSPLGLRDLSVKLHQRLPEQMYMLARLEPGSKDGWLPSSVWDFVNNPAPAHARAHSA